MNNTNRIIFNTIVLYAKIVIVMIINLWTVPLLLRALGQSDYGIYQLVAGVIAMLSFLNAAMTVSSQRFLSVTMGEKNEKKLNVVYNASIVLHIVIGLAIVVLLEICAPFLFSGFLNIPEGRTIAAKWVYQFLIISTFFTIAAVPFDAVLNAHENMIVFAIINIMEISLKLVLALLLPYLPGDSLIFYGGGWALISIIGVCTRYIYTRLKYRSLVPDYKQFDISVFKEMFGFAGWNTFSAFAMVGRNQGIAIILNWFLGTIVNAAYGIANQINGLLVYFSATLQKSINPQLMKSEGMHDEKRLILFAYSLSKASFLALSILAIPLIIEMPYVLSLWLGEDIPANTIEFSRYILVMSMIYQFSAGLMSSIQSRGIIRNYTLTICGILLLNLPIAYIILRLGYPSYYVMIGMIAVELSCLIVRLCFAHHLCRVDIRDYCIKIILPSIIVVCIVFTCLWIISNLFESSFIRLCIICTLDVALFAPLSYYFILSKIERERITHLLHPFLSRIKK